MEFCLTTCIVQSCSSSLKEMSDVLGIVLKYSNKDCLLSTVHGIFVDGFVRLLSIVYGVVLQSNGCRHWLTAFLVSIDRQIFPVQTARCLWYRRKMSPLSGGRLYPAMSLDLLLDGGGDELGVIYESVPVHVLVGQHWVNKVGQLLVLDRQTRQIERQIDKID